MSYKVGIRQIQQVTDDVKLFKLDHPGAYDFIPGQVTEVSIDEPDWEEVTRPYSFTGLTDEPALELIIKIFDDRDGLTQELDKRNIGDQLIVREPQDAIRYKNTGVFFAEDIGVTSFISILRRLDKEDQLDGNRLFYSTRSEEDIILENELEGMLGRDLIVTLQEPEEPKEKFVPLEGGIDEDFLEENIQHFDQPFYVCGSREYVETVVGFLKEHDAEVEKLVYED